MPYPVAAVRNKSAGGKVVATTPYVIIGDSGSINYGSHASIDNLAAGAMTYELWFSAQSGKSYGFSGLLYKEHVSIQYDNYYINRILYQAGNSGGDRVFYEAALPAIGWHHIAITFDGAGDKKMRSFLDGVLLNTSVPWTSALTDYSANNMMTGASYDLGWIRISNSLRYTGNYVVPSRLVYPEVDANTLRLFKCNEGTGNVLIDYSTNAQNASLSGSSWGYG